jgi:tetratricopeptide (TPR) repeat protein
MRALASLLLVVVLDGWSFAAAPPARLTAEQAEQLAQSQRWLQRATTHYGAGEIDKVIEALHKGLALERSLFGHLRAASLLWLERQAVLLEHRERFADAILARQELLRRRHELHGLDDWRVTDARLDLQNTRLLVRLETKQRQQLRQAGQWDTQVVRLWQQGRSREALPLAEKALATRRAILGEKHPHYATSMNNLGMLYQDMGDHQAALPLYKQVLEVRKAALGQKHPNYANSLNNLANLYHAMGDHQAALPLLQQALQVRKAALGEKHPLHATSLNNLAGLYQAMGDHQAALPLFQQALQVFKAVLGEKHPDYATTLNNLASLYRAMGDHKAALPLYQQALQIKKTALGEKHPLYASSLSNLAGLYQAMGDHQAAMPLYQQALQIRKAALGQKHPLYASGLISLAVLYQAMGEHQAALTLYKQALQVYKAVLGEKHPDFANSLNNLAALYKDMGNHRAALPLFQQALQIRKVALSEKHPRYALSLDSLAGLYQAMGDHQAALPLYKQALQIKKAALGEKHPDYARSLNNLAMLYKARGDHKAALSLLQQARQVLKEAQGEKHPSYATSLNNLAALYQDRGDHQAALPLAQQALQIKKAAQGEKHPDYALSLHNLAFLYQEMGDHQAALPLFEQALQVYKAALGEQHPHYAHSLNNLATLYQGMKQPQQAQRLCEQGLAITRTNLLLSASVQSERQQLAAAQAVRHQLDFRLSLAEQDKEGPAGCYRHVLAWKGAIFLQQRQRRDFARLLASSRAEVRTLLEQLRQSTRQLAALTLAPVDARTAAARRQQAEKLTQEKEELESRLSGLSRTFREQHRQGDLTPAHLQQVLPADAALVDFLFYTHHDPTQTERSKRWQRRLSAWVVRPNQAVVRIDLGPAAPLEQAATAWRQALTRRGSAGGAGRNLHRLLWQPLAKHLGGVKTVLISPDGVLGTVPFAALPGRKEGTYLIEDVALAVVPVPQLLPQMLAPVPKEKRLKPSLLLVGDVNFDSSQTAVASADERSAPRGELQTWIPLPATQAEAAAVKDSFTNLFKAETVTDLRKGQARKTAVRQALVKSRYAHLATHGFFAPPALKSALADTGPGNSAGLFGREGVTGWHPLLLSGLVLAGANKEAKPGEEDGILTALEVSEMDLSGLELTVLSACETGLGKQAGGEGLLGLQRAFAVAGCRSVVASLWKVDDRATQALMAAFYRVWWGKKDISRVEAVRQAQLTMLKEGVGSLESKALPMRGRVGKALPVRPGRKDDRLPPYYWAAFVLSGDWR